MQAVATAADVEAQIQRLVDTAKVYDPSLEHGGTAMRMSMVAQAKELVQSLTHPMDMGSVHLSQVGSSLFEIASLTMSLQAMELVAVRTLLHLKAFHNIPTTGSISLEALSAATKTQPSLLGEYGIA